MPYALAALFLTAVLPVLVAGLWANPTDSIEAIPNPQPFLLPQLLPGPTARPATSPATASVYASLRLTQAVGCHSFCTSHRAQPTTLRLHLPDPQRQKTPPALV